MRIKEGFILKEMGGESVVVTIGEASKQFHGMLFLNETSRFLWEQLGEEKTRADLVQALVKEYEISEEKAENGVQSFLTLFEDVDCIEE